MHVMTNAIEIQGLDVQMLSPSAWRIRDIRFPEHDARALIGFVEKKDDVYEVMQLGSGFQWFTYPSLAQAVAHFVRSGTEADAEIADAEIHVATATSVHV